MKNYLLIFAAVIAISFKPSGGITGTMFPTMDCEDYNGKKVSLPIDTKGKYTLLGMAFSNKSEEDLKTWMNPIYNKFIAAKDNDPFNPAIDYDINLFFVPMFTGANQLTSKQSKEKIKAATDKEMYANILFYEGAKTYKEELDFEKKDIPYFFVLDKTGKIMYATSGKYDQSKLDKILDIIEEN
jgi:hypothetical protein